MLTMDASARGWIYKQAAKNYWRVAAWYELEDLVQDGCMHYIRILRKYSDVKDKPHIMSLFQRTFINHIHDLSKRRTLQTEQTFSSMAVDDATENSILDRLGFSESLSEVAAVLWDAPKPVLDALSVLMSDRGRRALQSHYRRRLNGTRETTNERLCRLVGCDPKSINLADALRIWRSQLSMIS